MITFVFCKILLNGAAAGWHCDTVLWNNVQLNCRRKFAAGFLDENVFMKISCAQEHNERQYTCVRLDSILTVKCLE